MAGLAVVSDVRRLLNDTIVRFAAAELADVSQSLGESDPFFSLAAIDGPQIRRAIEELDRTVRRLESSPASGRPEQAYGTLRQFDGRARILRGHLDRYRSRPLVRTRDPGVMHMIVALPN